MLADVGLHVGGKPLGQPGAAAARGEQDVRGLVQIRGGVVPDPLDREENRAPEGTRHLEPAADLEGDPVRKLPRALAGAEVGRDVGDAPVGDLGEARHLLPRELARLEIERGTIGLVANGVERTGRRERGEADDKQDRQPRPLRDRPAA